jgi:hypothetical protein
MSLETETSIAIKTLLLAHDEALSTPPGRVTWLSTTEKLQVRVGDEEMSAIVTDDINFYVPFVARIGEQAFYISPSLT